MSAVIACLVLSACQSRTASEESTAYRNYFTEAEKEGGTANFELMKNVIVDTQITLAEKYSSGLKKYYLEHYFEAGKDTDDREKFKKNLRLYGKTIPEIYKDTAEVIDPDKILEQIEKYYNRLLLTSPIIVTDIRLAYTGFFTDGSEGGNPAFGSAVLDCKSICWRGNGYGTVCL